MRLKQEETGLEQEIELREIFFIIRKRAWMVVAITGLALVLSAVISLYVQTPLYRTSTTLIVIKEDQLVVDQGTLMLNRQLVKTYARSSKAGRWPKNSSPA